jgi:hypothetical protein
MRRYFSKKFALQEINALKSRDFTRLDIFQIVSMGRKRQRDQRVSFSSLALWICDGGLTAGAR